MKLKSPNQTHQPWRYLVLSFLAITTLKAVADDVKPVKVETYAQHVGANIVNHYILTNHSGREIVTFHAGYYTENLETGAGETEFETDPAGSYWKNEDILTGGINSGPTTWQPHLMMQESTMNIAYTWGNSGPSDVLQSGSSLRFSIATPARDASYLTSHFTVHFNFDGIKPRRYSGQMELIDRTPPTLSLIATPSMIWPPNNKRVPVSITVNVTDDYDGAPEIVLESITANEALTTNDIVGADLGKDDRNFDLMATRAGGNTTGRIYTITYAAIDASGNKSIASVNVSVPHDRSKK